LVTKLPPLSQWGYGTEWVPATFPAHIETALHRSLHDTQFRCWPSSLVRPGMRSP